MRVHKFIFEKVDIEKEQRKEREGRRQLYLYKTNRTKCITSQHHKSVASLTNFLLCS